MKEFEYIAPTAVTLPKHETIKAAHESTVEMINDLHNNLPENRFTRINTGCKAFALVIQNTAPPSADTTTAIRCVRLARMLLNQMLLLRWTEQRRQHFRTLAEDELLKASLWASAAIALHDWPENG